MWVSSPGKMRFTPRWQRSATEKTWKKNPSNCTVLISSTQKTRTRRMTKPTALSGNHLIKDRPMQIIAVIGGRRVQQCQYWHPLQARRHLPHRCISHFTRQTIPGTAWQWRTPFTGHRRQKTACRCWSALLISGTNRPYPITRHFKGSGRDPAITQTKKRQGADSDRQRSQNRKPGKYIQSDFPAYRHTRIL